MADNSEGTCPVGGSWYTCTDQTPTFFGCCTSNPCNGVGCPSSDLRAAGMGTGSGPNLLVNDSSYWPNVFCAHGQWWTCADQTPSFQGCCISDPCANAGCPMGNLFPAAFGTVSSAAPTSASKTTSASSSIQTTSPSIQTTSASIKLLTSSSTSTFQSTTLTTSAAMMSTSSSVAHLPTPTPSPGPNIAAIAGGAAGGSFAGVLLLLIIAFAIWRCRRRRKSNASPESDASNPRFGPKGPNSPYNDEAYYPGQPRKPTPSSSPPSYQSPQRSPNRNRYTYEIDSTELHEIDGRRALDRREINTDGRIEGGAAHGLGLGQVAELPNNSRSLRMSR